MKPYTFTNLFGAVYERGNLLFLNNGTTVISPVGNRISIYDITKSKSETLPLALNRNIAKLAISPCNYVLIAIDEEGEVFVISIENKCVLHQQHMGKEVRDVKFSPDGTKLLITKANLVLLFNAPNLRDLSNPLHLIRKFSGADQDTTCLDWTTDSRFFLVGEYRNTRLYPTFKSDQVTVWTNSGHSDEIVGCFFEKDSLNYYSLAKDGTYCYFTCDHELDEVIENRYKKVDPGTKDAQMKIVDVTDEGIATSSSSEDDEIAPCSGEMIRVKKSMNKLNSKVKKTKKNTIKYTRAKRSFFNVQSDMQKITTCDFNKKTRVMIVGFEGGDFYLYEMPDLALIHSLNMSKHSLTTSVFNRTGDWLALASSHGELVVWEWTSENFKLKQQSHLDKMNTVAYSPDGSLIATGGEDSKVKLWDSATGFSKLTKTDHEGPVTQVLFAKDGTVVLSCSFDGTVRAFDTKRYNTFRTMYTPNNSQTTSNSLFQLNCMACTDETVCAGALDSFDIFVWQLKTGTLIDTLSGHEGPVVSMMFCPTNLDMLISGSWDETVQVWKIGTRSETLEFNHQVLAVAFSPDGKQIGVSTGNADLTFWNAETLDQMAAIDCRKDIISGRGKLDGVSSKTMRDTKAYDSICYSVDGKFMLAGGRSMYIGLYCIKAQKLMKRFEICKNLSFDGTEEWLSRRQMTEFGPRGMIDMSEGLKLPGTKTKDLSKRVFNTDISVMATTFSPTGREFAAVSSEGLLIYSQENMAAFDPFQLDTEVTPENIRKTLESKDYVQALMMCFRLNREKLTDEVTTKIPQEQIPILVKQLPPAYINRMVQYCAGKLETSIHTEFYLKWCHQLVYNHANHLKKTNCCVKGLMKTLNNGKPQQIYKLMDSNHYMMELILNHPEDDDDSSSDDDVIMSCEDSSDNEDLGDLF